MFRERLKQARKAKGFTQESFAKALNITYASVTAYEQGKNMPSLTVLCKISDILEVSTDYLLGRSDK